MINTKSKIYRLKNADEIREYQRNYYAKNRKKILANAKKRPKRQLSDDEKAIKAVKHRIYMKNRRAKNKV